MKNQTKESILFVDDEESLLEIASEYFEMKGYRVITAGNGAEALEVLENHTVDCCFTDINMPEMDGLELAERIRLIDNTIPVIVMTGFPSLDNTIQTLRNGVVDFLVKPVNLNQMEMCLRSVLRERRLFVDNIFLKQEVEKKERLEKLNRELNYRVEELQILTKILEDFTTVRKSIDVFQRLVDMTVEITRAHESRFYVANDTVPEPFEVTAAFSDSANGEMATQFCGGGKVSVRREETVRLVREVVQGRIQAPLMIPDSENTGEQLSAGHSCVAVPLLIRDKIFGVLTAAMRDCDRSFTGKTLYYLSFMTHKAAYAIENLALYENIYENLLATLDALVQAIEAKDFYTKEHSRQVTEIAIAIAQQMGCGREDMDILEVAGPLHDIGKIGIPDNILLKPGRLTAEEYEEIKRHPVIGAEIVGRLGLWDREQQIIKHHHERFDGTGYPDKIRGEGIPLLARILSVADVYDAMASNRVYRKRMPEDMVLETIYKGSGTQFDPEVISAFRALYDAGQIGTSV